MIPLFIFLLFQDFIFIIFCFIVNIFFFITIWYFECWNHTNYILLITFIFQNFVVSLFSFVISMGFVYLGVFFINIILSLNSIANTIYLIANIYCWLIAFGVSFVLSFVACIIPLKIINKMNPIDSIKCIN